MNYALGSVLISLVLLTGCAHDNYTVIPDSEGSKEKMSYDLSNCNRAVLHEYYYQDTPPVSGGRVLGIIAGGVLGGAIGGAGMSVAINNNEEGYAIKRKDLDKLAEECMLDKGYVLDSKKNDKLPEN